MNNQTSLNHVFNILEAFQLSTGSNVNYDKTIIYRIGLLKSSDTKLITTKTVSWTSEPINVLGIWITHDVEDLMDRNYTPIVDKISAIIKRWANRTLSLFGKISVVNTLIASLVVYKMMVLPTIPRHVVQKLESLIENFIWAGANPKIPLSTLQKRKEDGGTGLIDFVNKDMSLKLNWVVILEKEYELATLAYQIIEPNLKQKVWLCSIKQDDVKHLIKDPFWSDVMVAWRSFVCNNVDYHTPIVSQIIWWNSDIRIDGTPVVWNEPLKKGLLFVHQLFRGGTTINVQEACVTYSLDIMQYNSLIVALPQEWRV